MQRFLLLMCSLSLILAGSFFLHEQDFADGLHLHSQSAAPDETSDHSHFSLTQNQQDADTSTLHCGSNILALIEWVGHHCFVTEQTIPVGQSYSRYGVWTMLDPPPPRPFSRSTTTTA